MTRINAGIDPSELCDQHLVAEYRELPRIRSLALARATKHGGAWGPRPETFTLGGGHVAYFLPFGRWLCQRWYALRDEMRTRGMDPALDWRPYPWMDINWQPNEACARPLLQARILARLSTMRRRPNWTNRQPPAWITTP